MVDHPLQISINSYRVLTDTIYNEKSMCSFVLKVQTLKEKVFGIIIFLP